jgi:hypothetical protein
MDDVDQKVLSMLAEIQNLSSQPSCTERIGPRSIGPTAPTTL